MNPRRFLGVLLVTVLLGMLLFQLKMQGDEIEEQMKRVKQLEKERETWETREAQGSLLLSPTTICGS